MSVQQQERAMREVLDGLERQDGETKIRSVYRKCQALKDNRPKGLEDADLDVWVEAADEKEERIARFQAEDLGDIDAKLAVLIDRIRLFMEANKAGAFDLILAMSAREDLQRLTEQCAEEPRARSIGEAKPAAARATDKTPAPWPTCDNSTGRCHLYSEISDMETDLANLQRGIDTLFNLLEGCSMKDTPVELELESAYFFAFAFNDYLKSLKAKWDGLQAESGDNPNAVDGRAEP